MSRFSRCDSCRAEVALPFQDGWLMIVHADDDSRCDVHTLTFCGWRCLAEYATAKALVGGATDESKPP